MEFIHYRQLREAHVRAFRLFWGDFEVFALQRRYVVPAGLTLFWRGDSSTPLEGAKNSGPNAPPNLNPLSHSAKILIRDRALSYSLPTNTFQN